MKDQAQPTSQPKSSTTSAFDSSESMEGGTYLSPPAFSLTASSANSPGEPESAGPDANTVTLVSGQMTRLGEDKPKYIYWPVTTSSGVTLGIGYDIGGRSKASVITQLTAAGMSADQATKIAEGAGLKGDAANQFVIDNQKSIGTIADAVAEALFTDTMAAKRKEAKALATSKTPSTDSEGNYVNARGREMQDQVEEGSYVMSGEQWDRLHPAMVELITDMKFHGGFYAYDRIAKVNAILIAHDGDDLAQFKGVAALFEADENGEISYMDKYHDKNTPKEDPMNYETFFGQTKAEMSRSWRRRNRVRYAFLLQVIKALESGKAVAMSGQANLPRPVATPVAKSPAFAEGDRILATAETAGASLETAKAQDPTTNESGASASEKLVRGDLDSIVPLADLFKEIGNEKGLPPALLAAIASRETSIGKKLNANDCTPDGKHTGVMGINDQVHPSPGNEDQRSNIVRAASILVNLRAEIQAKFPAWSPAYQLLGAVTAYNQSAGFVAKWDGKAIEGDDFASDTWARARYLAALKMFSGLDPIPVIDSKDKGKETTDPAIRPAVKKGRLIAQSVGRGGINHPDDVQAVLQRLLELDVISQQEAGIQTESAVGEYVERYQNLIFNKGADGLMEPGKLTETKLINGERNKPTPTKKQPSEPKGGPKGDKNPPKRKEKNPKAGSKPEVPDYKSIAERVNHEMVGGFFWGAGTDETGISIALSELHRDATHIKEFKAVYQTMYGRDLVEHIDSEVDNYFLFVYHGQLDEIMSWLTPKADFAPADKKKVDGKGDPISAWLGKVVQEGSVGETNKQYAELILEAEELGLVTFSDEGMDTNEFESGKGGCEDTFMKIKEGKPIGNGKKNKKGQDYFYPETEAMPILPVLHSTIQGMVSDWNDGGRVGAATNLKLGSFMVWNDNGSETGVIRHSNHGIKARAIDINMDTKGNDFSQPEAVDLVLNVLKNAPVGSYELGMPRQGLFFDASDFGSGNPTKAIDGSHAYTKLKSDELRTQIETMLNDGYVLKVMVDAPNHLHFSVGSGGSNYLTKADIP